MPHIDNNHQLTRKHVTSNLENQLLYGSNKLLQIKPRSILKENFMNLENIKFDNITKKDVSNTETQMKHVRLKKKNLSSMHLSKKEISPLNSEWMVSPNDSKNSLIPITEKNNILLESKDSSNTKDNILNSSSFNYSKYFNKSDNNKINEDKDKIEEKRESLSNNSVTDKNSSKPKKIKFADNVSNSSKSAKKIIDSRNKINKYPNIYDSASDDDFVDIYNGKLKAILHFSIFSYLWRILFNLVNFTVSCGYLFISLYFLELAEVKDKKSIFCLQNLLFLSAFDVIMLIDIVLMFFTTYLNDKDNVVVQLDLIVERYLEGWFLFDLITAFPYYAIGYYYHTHVNDLTNNFGLIIKFVILKWGRVLKVMQINYSKESEDSSYINNIFFSFRILINKIVDLFLLLVLFIHFTSCFWIIIGFFQNSSNDPINWLTHYDSLDKRIYSLYIDSLYFVMTSILTVGYGDVLPISKYEKIFVIILILFGSLYYSYLLSSISNIVHIKNSKTQTLINQENILYELKKDYTLKNNLVDRLYKQIRHSFHKDRMDLLTFLESLPHDLKNYLYLKIFDNHIRNYKLFANKNPDFAIAIIPYLKSTKYLKFEPVIYFGEVLEEMIIVNKGLLSIRLDSKYNGFSINEIKENYHFGDVYLVNGEPCIFEITTKTADLDLITLHKQYYAHCNLNFRKEIFQLLKNSVVVIKRLKLLRHEAIKHYEKYGTFESFISEYGKANVYDKVFKKKLKYRSYSLNIYNKQKTDKSEKLKRSNFTNGEVKKQPFIHSQTKNNMSDITYLSPDQKSKFTSSNRLDNTSYNYDKFYDDLENIDFKVDNIENISHSTKLTYKVLPKRVSSLNFKTEQLKNIFSQRVNYNLYDGQCLSDTVDPVIIENQQNNTNYLIHNTVFCKEPNMKYQRSFTIDNYLAKKKSFKEKNYNNIRESIREAKMTSRASYNNTLDSYRVQMELEKYNLPKNPKNNKYSNSYHNTSNLTKQRKIRFKLSNKDVKLQSSKINIPHVNFESELKNEIRINSIFESLRLHSSDRNQKIDFRSDNIESSKPIMNNNFISASKEYSCNSALPNDVYIKPKVAPKKQKNDIINS